MSFFRVLSDPVPLWCFPSRKCVFFKELPQIFLGGPQPACHLLRCSLGLQPLLNLALCPLHEVHIKILSYKTLLAKLVVRPGRRLHKLVAHSSTRVQQVQQLLGLMHILSVFSIQVILVLTCSVWWFLTEGRLASAYEDYLIKP